MTRIGKYLSVRLLVRPATRKTDVWALVANDGAALATIKWYGPWRQYVLEPEFDTVFNATCLVDVVQFLNQVNGKRGEDTHNRRQLAKMDALMGDSLDGFDVAGHVAAEREE